MLRPLKYRHFGTLLSIVALSACGDSAPSPSPGPGPGPITVSGMNFEFSDEEVYLLELINRTRANPDAESTRTGVDLRNGLSADQLSIYGPREPLAFNENLETAARAHTEDMNTQNYFSHTSPNGDGPTQRTTKAGYVGWAAENIAAGQASIYQAHLGWLQSLGHRLNILSLYPSGLNAAYTEVGLGIKIGGAGQWRNYYTEVFGLPQNQQRYILGVVYEDADNDNFYSMGEGLEGVTIEVVHGSTIVKTLLTKKSGNYQVSLPDGAYTLKFKKSSGEIYSTSAHLEGQNIKVDAESSQFQ